MNMQYRIYIFTYLIYLVLINHWFIICFTSRIGIDRKAIAANNFQISSIVWKLFATFLQMSNVSHFSRITLQSRYI